MSNSFVLLRADPRTLSTTGTAPATQFWPQPWGQFNVKPVTILMIHKGCLGREMTSWYMHPPHKEACSEPPQPDTTIRSVVRVHRSLTKWLVTYCVCSGRQWGSLHGSSFIATVIPKHNLAWVCTTNDKIRMKFCKRSRHYSWLQRSRIFVFKI